MDWLNDNAGAIQALSTVALLFVTALYVWFTRSLADEARRTQRPYVHIDIDARKGRDLQLIVGNAGERAANDIAVKIVDRGSQRRWGRLRRRSKRSQALDLEPLRELPPVRNGLPYLAPGRAYRWDLRGLGRIDELIKGDPGENVIEVEISYHSAGHRYSETTLFDFAVFNGLRIQTFADPLSDIADHLNHIARSAEKLHREGRDPFGFCSSCPYCTEPLQKTALKCPACREWLLPVWDRFLRRVRREFRARPRRSTDPPSVL